MHLEDTPNGVLILLSFIILIGEGRPLTEGQSPLTEGRLCHCLFKGVLNPYRPYNTYLVRMLPQKPGCDTLVTFSKAVSNMLFSHVLYFLCQR